MRYLFGTLWGLWDWCSWKYTLWHSTQSFKMTIYHIVREQLHKLASMEQCMQSTQTIRNNVKNENPPPQWEHTLCSSSNTIVPPCKINGIHDKGGVSRKHLSSFKIHCSHSFAFVVPCVSTLRFDSPVKYIPYVDLCLCYVRATYGISCKYFSDVRHYSIRVMSNYYTRSLWITSSPPSAEYMRRQLGQH